jgi:hypothetical protein
MEHPRNGVLGNRRLQSLQPVPDPVALQPISGVGIPATFSCVAKYQLGFHRHSAHSIIVVPEKADWDRQREVGEDDSETATVVQPDQFKNCERYNDVMDA